MCEADNDINVKTALVADLILTMCIYESLRECELSITKVCITVQIEADLSGVAEDKNCNIVVTYE